MFRETKLGGVSFRSRDRRRVLVIATYAAVLLYLTVELVANLYYSQLAQMGLSFFGVVLVLVTNVIFGALVRQQTLPDRVQRPQSLGIAPTIIGDDPGPDEFETSVRNAAYYKAYKFLAWYVVLVGPLLGGLMEVFGASARRAFGISGLLLLLALFFSLPQAIILWEQSDFVED